MPYLVSLALLVALAAWMVGVYNQLEHLRGVVCHCWGQWRKATQRRNESLRDFAAVFAMFMPPDAALPRDLRRLAEDSERTLALSLEPRWSRSHGFVGEAEKLLRMKVERSVQAVEDSPVMRAHDSLQRLCCSMSVSLYQQEKVAALFNQAAGEYNAALRAPSARLLAPIFGFLAADTLESGQKNDPQRLVGTAGRES